jgi:hypothetical protein
LADNVKQRSTAAVQSVPNWGIRLVVLIIAIGFPITLIVAQPFERTPKGNHETIFVANAHRDDGKRFIVRPDEKLTAFLELETQLGTSIDWAVALRVM